MARPQNPHPNERLDGGALVTHLSDVLTTAEDIGRAAAWFCSPTAARQVTGQLISVSGGYTMP